MQRIYALAFILLAAVVCFAQTAYAQNRAGGTQSGTFGSRSLGGGMSGASGSFMGSGQGMGSSAGMGSSTGGTGNRSAFQNSPVQAAQQSVGGQARQSGSFVGATAQQAQQGFVGAAQAGGNQRGGRGTTGAAGMTGVSPMMAFGLGARLGGMNSSRSQQNGNNRSLRATVSLGFTPPAADPNQVGSAMARRLAALPALHWKTRPQVQMQGQTAILRGEVATQHDRDLAERVVRLEATVDQVQNQLVVTGSPQPGAGSSPPAGQQESPAANRAATGNSTPASKAASTRRPAVPAEPVEQPAAK